MNNKMDIQNILLLITAGVNFALALFVLLKNPKEKSNLVFILLVIGLGLWSLGITMFRYESLTGFSMYWTRFHFIASTFIAFLFYYFTYFYPYQIFRERGVRTVIHFVLLLSVVMLTLQGSGYIESARSIRDVTLHQLKYLIFGLYFLYFSLSGFYLLIKKIKRASGSSRFQLRIVFAATLVAGTFGIFFNLFLPFFTYEFIYLGPYFTVVTAFIVFYFIFIKQPS